jgi:hypothetical protein
MMRAERSPPIDSKKYRISGNGGRRRQKQGTSLRDIK